MDKNAAISQRLHYAAKRLEVLDFRRSEIHRNMEVGHAQPSDDPSFISERIVGCRQRKVDNRIVSGFRNGAELLFARLTARAQLFADRSEIVDSGQCATLSAHETIVRDSRLLHTFIF